MARLSTIGLKAQRRDDIEQLISLLRGQSWAGHAVSGIELSQKLGMAQSTFSVFISSVEEVVTSSKVGKKKYYCLREGVSDVKIEYYVSQSLTRRLKPKAKKQKAAPLDIAYKEKSKLKKQIKALKEENRKLKKALKGVKKCVNNIKLAIVPNNLTNNKIYDNI